MSLCNPILVPQTGRNTALQACLLSRREKASCQRSNAISQFTNGLVRTTPCDIRACARSQSVQVEPNEPVAVISLVVIKLKSTWMDWLKIPSWTNWPRFLQHSKAQVSSCLGARTFISHISAISKGETIYWRLQYYPAWRPLSYRRQANAPTQVGYRLQLSRPESQ